MPIPNSYNVIVVDSVSFPGFDMRPTPGLIRLAIQTKRGYNQTNLSCARGVRRTWVAHGFGFQAYLGCALEVPDPLASRTGGGGGGLPRLTLATFEVAVIIDMMFCFQKNRHQFIHKVFDFFSWKNLVQNKQNFSRQQLPNFTH